MDFVVEKDIGGTISMLLFMMAMAISLVVLCQEFKMTGKGTYGQYLRMEQDEKLEALTGGGGNDSDNEIEYDSDYKNVGRMSVSHRYSTAAPEETFEMAV